MKRTILAALALIDHDKNVGELLDLVDKLGIAKDTIVVYSTDNGPHMNTWPDGAMTPFRNDPRVLCPATTARRSQIPGWRRHPFQQMVDEGFDEGGEVPAARIDHLDRRRRRVPVRKNALQAAST